MKKDEILFAKVDKHATIPSKRDEDAGYDIYPCFDEDYRVIMPHETVMIPTGIASAFDKSWYVQIQERGSTGSKGIKYGAGVIDSGYRGEWWIPITNTNTVPVVISKLSEKETRTISRLYNCIFYPYSKAIAQFLILPVPVMRVHETTMYDLLSHESKRGTDCLGSSNK